MTNEGRRLNRRPNLRLRERLSQLMRRKRRTDRLLFVAACNASAHQLMEKLDVQYRELRTSFAASRGLVVGIDDTWRPEQGFALEYVDLRSQGFAPEEAGQALGLTIRQALEDFPADVVFMRYPYYKNKRLLKIVQDHGGFFFEHHTLELPEFKLKRNRRATRQEERWGPSMRANALGLISVTPEIAEYELEQASAAAQSENRRTTPPASLIVTNGIKLTPLPPEHSVEPPSTQLRIIVVANLSPWHGVDRVLQGMAEDPDLDITFDVVGTGSELETLKELAETLQIAERVSFHGYLEGQELNDVFKNCHMAVGVLAGHRKGILHTSALKHREYALRGIPFVYAGNDIDFDDHTDFALRIPADESAIDLDQVFKFADSYWRLGHDIDARNFAMAELGWDHKMGKVAEFMIDTAQKRERQPANSRARS